MRGSGIRHRARLIPLAVLAAAILVLLAGCDRPEPPPDDRPKGPRVTAPGGAVPPPGAPAELAHPMPQPEPPAAGPPDSPPAAKEQPPETGVGSPASPPAPVAQEGAKGEERAPEPAPAAPPEAPPPPPAVDTATRETAPVAGPPGAAEGTPPPQKEPAARKAGDRAPPERKAGGEKTARKAAPAGRTGAPGEADLQQTPIWAREGEELYYRVTFMGVTAGYARFISKGKVRIGERDAYHVLVKAWTSGTLAALFPISESFDYYLDTQTLAPIRRDSWIKKSNRPEIVLYDQEKGTITYWYSDTMEVRKKQQVPPPGFYEGVSATYFFRSRGIGDSSVSIRLFGGRKVYRVSSERAGEETIPYGKGKVETFLVKPVYREEGGSGETPMVGELLVWVSKDSRRVPVKLYASFKKGLEWKLVGELLSGLPGS